MASVRNLVPYLSAIVWSPVFVIHIHFHNGIYLVWSDLYLLQTCISSKLNISPQTNNLKPGTKLWLLPNHEKVWTKMVAQQLYNGLTNHLYSDGVPGFFYWNVISMECVENSVRFFVCFMNNMYIMCNCKFYDKAWNKDWNYRSVIHV